MRRACKACGRTFVAKNDRHVFCSTTCRSRGNRGATVVPIEAAKSESESESASSVETATRRQLEAVDRLDTPAGQSALLLARKLDVGGDTGSAMAALARQHLASLEEATRNVAVADDPVDELRARRKRRLSG